MAGYVLRAGGVVIPMNPLLKAREVAYYLGDSGAGLVFAWHAFAEAARGGAEQAGAETIITAGELRDYVKGQVAAYKHPRHVWLMDALPKGGTGKIVKRDIIIPSDLAAPDLPRPPAAAP
jgi:acyl-CoA synthetase (AMP-forming)/AMP-acid ligase II